ncbi:MAG: hypothetical protein HZB80_07815 [Deltaproteobacteria bacterium]|nr:hypothetical protein [Deltaproteobacteria bacterium]
MNGALSIDKLMEKEGELFGNSDEKVGRSKFALFPNEQGNISKALAVFASKVEKIVERQNDGDGRT